MAAHRTALSEWPAVVAAAWLVVTSNTPAIAQTMLYVLSSDYLCATPLCPPGRLLQLDLEHPAIVTDRPVHHTGPTVTRPRVTADGRYVVWFGSEWGGVTPPPLPVLNLFDTGTGVQTVSLAADTPGPVSFTLHPFVMRGFFQLSLFGPVVVAEPGGTRALPAPCAQPLFSGRSGDGRRLSYSCGVDAVVTDSDSGQITARLTEVWGSHTLNDDGTELLAAYFDWDGFYPPEYQRRDVATGTLLARRVAPYEEFVGGLWGVNWVDGQVYVSGSTGITVLDAATLEPRGLIPRFAGRYATSGALDAERSLLYLVYLPLTADQRTVLTAVDTRTLATIGATEIPVGRELVGIALGPRPPQVSNLTASVQPATATLSWTIAGRTIATQQLVEVGLVAGQTLLRLPVAAGLTTLTVPGVPSGRYFARVRSVNGTGLGTPSNEVVVDVP